MRLLIFDGLNLIRRIHAGIPISEADHAEMVVRSCKKSVTKYLGNYSPSHAMFIMEDSGTSWRTRENPEYKKGRSEMPEDLKPNIPLILSALEKISVKSLSVPGIEADDVIATIVKHAAHKKLEAIIISSDTSFCQLVRPGVYSVDAFKKLNRDEKWIEKKFGVKPNKLIDLLSLSGIPALGIKGIPSIGLHTAASLINKYGNLDKVIENSDSISGKVGENIRSNISSLASTKKMVALYQNVEMDSNLNKFRCDRK